MDLLTKAAIDAATVLIMGDLMLDRYVTGVVRRLSPEAPIPVLLPQRRRSVLGGAGNVAINVAALGAHAITIGLIGNDDAGHEITRVFRANTSNITNRSITVQDRSTTVKTRFVSGSHQLLRLDEEMVEPVSGADADALLATFEAALSAANVVVLSDYAKGVLPPYVLSRAVSMARAAGLLVIADPKRRDISAYAGVDFLTPNELEIEQATGIRVDSDDAAAVAGCRALTMSGARAVLVTRSSRGLTLVHEDTSVLHLPADAREVADVSGAGDTLVASFALMLATGRSAAEAASIANSAAGISVGKQGTASVSFAELSGALQNKKRDVIDDKILDLATALSRVTAWQAAGMQIGFTNGCFDLIHPGHARLLAKARRKCDRLVVGLNTDASVRRLKGEMRPVQDEMARAIVLASLGAVDLVILFDQDTPLDVIAALQPDILLKGADYQRDQVVGADLVESRGGKVILVDLEEGFSTTSIIQKMATASIKDFKSMSQ